MNQIVTIPSPATASAAPTDHRTEGAQMLIHEALARSRQREAELEARQYRRARELTAGRRWAQLAARAQRRAQVERDRVAAG
ncbi:MAG: hypothetical protein L0I76_11210 [Pseudonocardia sp.]|nr:hypothetical protein [Pseudonocardia sp.]